MRAIRQKTIYYGTLTVLSAAVSILIWTVHLSAGVIKAAWLLAASAATGVVLALLWLKEGGTLRRARLISENRIIAIRTAMIREKIGDREAYSSVENADVIVSNFGILLNAKVYEFNQGGDRLKGVEVGADYISLTYGTEERLENMRLLCVIPGERELEAIREKFRYETGIIPVVAER